MATTSANAADKQSNRDKQSGQGRGSAAGNRAYKWMALSNTTLGMSMATLDASIVIMSMPAIFRGIRSSARPRQRELPAVDDHGLPARQSVLVVTFGKLGDMFGRVKMYNRGFVVFTAASVALSLDPLVRRRRAVPDRMAVVQAVGGAMLMSNSTAILTDAFPGQRGIALGINQMAGISGPFIGLVLGGVLVDMNWRAVFWVVPFGLFGTVWAYT